MKQVVILHESNPDIPPLLVTDNERETSTSFTIAIRVDKLGISALSNLVWKAHLYSIAKHASQKMGFLPKSLVHNGPLAT